MAQMDVGRWEIVIPLWAFLLACAMFGFIGLALGRMS